MIIKYKIICKIVLYWKLRLEDLYTNKKEITKSEFTKKFFNYVECQYSKIFIQNNRGII